MRELREFLLTIAIVVGLICAAFLLLVIVIFFPGEVIRPFTEPPSIDPELTARLLSTINTNDDFPPGTFIVDVSEDVCSWASEQDLRELVERPGWQLMARHGGEFRFVEAAYLPWDRNGLQIGFRSDGSCYGYVRRADTIS